MSHTCPRTPDPAFKMLYILAIFMIIDGHIGSYDYLCLNNLMPYQNYHLALFMFTSGYFLNLKDSFKDYLLRKSARLLLPLYVWNFIYGFICLGLNNFAGFDIGGAFNFQNLVIAPLTDGHQFIYNMGTWFIAPLFVIQIISFCLNKQLEKRFSRSTCAVIFFVAALVAGCTALNIAPENDGKRNLILLGLRCGYFLPVFALGFLYKNCLEKYDKLNTPTFLFIIITLLGLLEARFPYFLITPSWLNYLEAPAIAVYGITFLCVLFWVRVAKVLSPLWERSPLLQYISDHTFDIMLHQFMALMLIKASLSALPFGGFDKALFKHDIWYLPFIKSETISSLPYIFITIVIALLAGFTSRKIYTKMKQILSRY